MRVLVTAFYEFLKDVRDIKMVALLVIMPVVLIYLVGNSLSSFLGSDTPEKIPTGIVVEDKGTVGSGFEKFLQADQLQKRLDIKEYGTLEEGKKALDGSSIKALVYLPENLSSNLAKGEKQSISLYGGSEAALVETVVSRFTSGINLAVAVAGTGGKPALQEQGSGSILKIASYSKNSKMPGSLDYYAVLTLLQVLFFGAILGLFITSGAAGSDLHIRFHTLPAGKYTILLGKILGSTAFLFLSAVFTMLFSKFVYGCNWDGNLLIILGTLLLFCVISVGAGILTGLLIPGYSVSIVLIFLLGVFFAAVSGGFSPSTAADSLNFLSPNYHAKMLIFGAIYDYPGQAMQKAFLWLVGMLAAVAAATALLMRRVSHDNI